MAWFVNRAPKAARPFSDGQSPKVVSFRVEKLFFDRVKLQELIRNKNLSALSKAGAYIRQRVRTKVLKRRNTPSAPGQPPSVHAKRGENYRTLRNVHFELDRDYESLVVGPHPISTKGNNNTVNAGYTVPQILEFGGAIQIKEEKPPDTINVQFDWRKPGVYNNPARRSNPRKKRQYAKGKKQPRNKWKPQPKGTKQNQPLLTRVRRTRIEKRPFMAVAFRDEVAAGKIQRFWKESLIGG